MFTIGITGPNISGRSTIARMLSHLADIPIVDTADIIQETIYNRFTMRDLTEAFGQEILDGDLIQNIQDLAFDDEKHFKLDGILFDAIESEIARRFALHELSNAKYVIYDTPELFPETNEIIDFMVLADAPAEIRAARLMNATEIEQIEADLIVNSGKSASEWLREPHDYYIDTNVNYSKLSSKVAFLWSKIREAFNEADIMTRS